MNKVVLLGRLTKDPELRFAAGSGTAVCRFTIAVNRPFKRDETDFITCVSFGKTGETISQNFTKGKHIAISGSIRTGSYDAKDGTKRYTTDVAIDSFEFAGFKSDNSGSDFGGDIANDNAYPHEDITQVDDPDMPF